MIRIFQKKKLTKKSDVIRMQGKNHNIFSTYTMNNKFFFSLTISLYAFLFALYFLNVTETNH